MLYLWHCDINVPKTLCIDCKILRPYKSVFATFYVCWGWFSYVQRGYTKKPRKGNGLKTLNSFIWKKTNRSNPPEVFSGKAALKICSKFTGEHPCWNNFIEIKLRHGCSVNMLHIFRTPFPKNTSGKLLLNEVFQSNIGNFRLITAQKMKFSIMGFFSKCDQTRSFLRIWSYLLKKFLMENFSFCVVNTIRKKPHKIYLFLPPHKES